MSDENFVFLSNLKGISFVKENLRNNFDVI